MPGLNLKTGNIYFHKMTFINLSFSTLGVFIFISNIINTRKEESAYEHSVVRFVSETKSEIE